MKKFYASYFDPTGKGLHTQLSQQKKGEFAGELGRSLKLSLEISLVFKNLYEETNPKEEGKTLTNKNK